MAQEKEKFNILLIGDDIETRIVFKNALSQVGKSCAVGDYFHLDQAEKEVRTQKVGVPQLIFLDASKDVQACTDHLRRIKALQELEHSPVVVYDSLAQLRDTSALFSEGAAAFINQPYDFSRLRKVINTIFNIDFNASASGAERMTYFL